MKRLSFAVLGRRLRHEHGFSLIEVVVAMGVIFFSMLMLVTTSIIGFNGAQVAKHRQTATALADKIVEQVRALPFTAVTEGLLDSDLSGDSNIVTGGGCGTAYEYQSCTIDSSNPPIGETIVHQASLTYSSGTPLYPHKVTLGSSAGFPQGGTQAVYITRVNGSTTVYRLTVVISWTLGARTQSIQTSTQLSNPTGSGGSSNNASTSTAYFYGSGTLSPGSVVVSPNASVYQGVGVSGITSGTWNTGDAMTQRLLSMDAEVTQGQLSVTSGQATTTSVEKSISGTVTSAGGTSTYSSADDDPNSSVGTSSNPTAISQPGSAVSMSLTGSGLEKR